MQSSERNELSKVSYYVQNTCHIDLSLTQMKSYFDKMASTLFGPVYR